MRRINVTKPVIPDKKVLLSYIEKVLETGVLTNSGPLSEELSRKISSLTGCKLVELTANGTDALMLALRGLDLAGKVITTPFTFAATVHAIKFLGLDPVFVDIDSDSLCLDADKVCDLAIEPAAILSVQVYGNVGNAAKLERFSKKTGVPLIFDASHSFGCLDENGRSLLDYGTCATTSFHATKTFSTVEGGAVFCSEQGLAEQIRAMRNFGFREDGKIINVGINSKISEFHSAFGLSTLGMMDSAIRARKAIFEEYRYQFKDVEEVKIITNSNKVHNYTYLPIVIDTKHNVTQDIVNALNADGIYPRRYFYPLLSNIPPYCDLPSANKSNLPVANFISERILCLPIYPGLETEDISRVCSIVKSMTLH